MARKFKLSLKDQELSCNGAKFKPNNADVLLCPDPKGDTTS